MQIPKYPNTQVPLQKLWRAGLGLWVFGCLGASLFIGCGGRDVEQVQVTGKVTLDGGPMPGPGTLYFTPVKAAGDAPLRPGTAQFDADGSYAAGSFESGDGLVPGTYNVAVHCWEVAPTMEDVTPVSFIPEKFTNAATSGLSVDVPSGSRSMSKDFNLVSEPTP